MQNRKLIVDMIGYDSGWGCSDYGCEDGPAAIDHAGILETLKKHGMAATDHGLMGLKSLGAHETLNDKKKTLPLVLEGLKRLSSSVQKAAAAKNIPLVIGGDHAAAIGTWSGVVSGRNSAGKFGLIWMDAHMDAHTYETSYQGKWGGWWHGQPVAALTGEGLPEFTRLCGDMKKISPAHFSIIGPHSFEPAEEEYVKKHNIRVYTLGEVEQRGFETVFKEALTRATQGTEGFGLSIDLDGFHGEEAPAVGTAEGKGLRTAEVFPVLRHIAHHPAFQALEIVEFNPHKDIDHKTRRLVSALIDTIFTPHAS